MSVRDHTRWNRAGRRRIEYVEGNAARFLELLRVELASRFSSVRDGQREWGSVHDDADATSRSDRYATLPGDPSALQARALARYEAEPGDIGWELARTFARACHVLAGHVDAYANEHYIETVTQWESVRRLVAMLDYDPNPPASASTPLVVLARAAGKIEAGALQVGHTPAKGDPVVFESLEALELAPELDGMRLAGWNRASGRADVRDMVWELPEGAEAASGDVALVEQAATGEGFATTIGWIDHGRLGPMGAPREGWPLAECRLWFGGKGARTPRMQGEPLVHVERGHGLDVGDVVAWKQGERWTMASVAVVDVDRLRLAASASPAPGTALYLAKVIADGEQARLPLGIAALGWLEDGRPTTREPDEVVETMLTYAPEAGAGAGAGEPPPAAAGAPPQPAAAGEPQPAAAVPPDKLKRLKAGTHEGPIHLVTKADAPRTRVVAAPPVGWLDFEGAPTGWSTGTWFVGELDDGELEALRLRELVALERGFRARFARASTRAVVRVYGPFKHALRPRGWDFDERVVSGGTLVLERDPGPALLGRRVVLRAIAGEAGAHVATVVRRRGPAIEIVPPLPAGLGLRGGELELHGNVPLFGHGERKPGQILGSGDATRSGQRFVLGVAGVSFVADPGRARGVRADIELLVGGRRWRQVDSLRDSGPTDEHYVVRMTETGQLALEGGDGTNGRRFPSGTNNLRVELRVGTGLRGNIPAGSLERLAKPHRLVERLLQPLPATGGNDMAGVDELRERAPGTVLTLGRAVALEDFGLLAGGHASLWQALARRLPVTGAKERVEIVVVPAGGGELGALHQVLRDYLLARTLPDVDIVLRGFVERGFSLLVKVAVDEDHYVAADVLRDVRAALEDRFSLRNRRLGQALEHAEVLAVVETTKGVDHSGVVIDGRPDVRRLVAGFDEVLVLHQLELVGTRETSASVTIDGPRRAIERRAIDILQGVGPDRDGHPGPYAKTLTGPRPEREPQKLELHELAAFDLGWSAPLPHLAQLSPTRLRELVVKARLVTELRVPEPLIVALGTRTLAELVHLDATLLAAHHQVKLEELLALRAQLRTLQMCLDERAMDTIRLAEFSVVPDLVDHLPPPIEPWHGRPVGSLPATVISGVGLQTARQLASPSIGCRTVADVAYLDPDQVAERTGLSAANLWEARLKARILLAAELPAALPDAARRLTTRELLALDRGRLQALTGLPDAELEALHRLLLELELALDEPPIEVVPGPFMRGPIEHLTLGELFGPPARTP